MTGIRVVSYNVRYANRNDHHDAWHERRDAVARLIRFHHPDILAVQEPVADQRRDLRERLPEYALVGRGRDADGDGEGCPIGVRTDRFQIADHGTFWLSTTPESPSTDWGATHPRVATWARVQPVRGSNSGRETDDSDRNVNDDSERRSFLIANTHFDHVSDRARRESARLLRRQLPEIAANSGETASDDETERSLPIVLAGDLNCTPESSPHRILTGDDVTDGIDTVENADPSDTPRSLRDAATAADLRHGPTTSLTDFARLIDGRRIDHVLVSPAIEVKSFATLTDRDDRGRYPSDHLPVLVKLTLPADR
ncbi:endonuclease/exonuclease/phosphatase family protein [Halorubrum laminariae]|uniref:Endonuclease/exonuclease/phosphatase family protein n=1 Tax=Halorubrum laminariae TaxID=1433523 RepID=A0ABD6C036_9EURY|nr:endonuclease/exonuclease/phosphatase family protein [Halorubrum laminariae]